MFGVYDENVQVYEQKIESSSLLLCRVKLSHVQRNSMHLSKTKNKFCGL